MGLEREEGSKKVGRGGGGGWLSFLGNGTCSAGKI